MIIKYLTAFKNQNVYVNLDCKVHVITGVILEGDVNCPTSPLCKLGEKWFYKNIPKDYHFSSKLQETVKTPCFKFVGLPLDNNLTFQ